MKHVFVAVLSLLMIPAAHAAWLQVEIEGEVVTFTDVAKNAWYVEYVQDAVEGGIASGYKNESGELTGKFGPGDNVTVAQALKMASESAGYDEVAYDEAVRPGCLNHWVCAYIAVAQKEELSLFADRPGYDRPATRAEVALLFFELFDLSPDDSFVQLPFEDVDPTSPSAVAIQVEYDLGIIRGDEPVDGGVIRYFRPNDPINRAEFLKIAYQFYGNFDRPGASKSPSSSTTGEIHTIEYQGDYSGFWPKSLTIKAGDTVRFINVEDDDVQVASDPHPTHVFHPELNYEGLLEIGDEFNVLLEKGTYTYHNHYESSNKGTIIVED